MSIIDAIRSKARHCAWNQEDGPNFNPFVFGRPVVRTKSRDLEEQAGAEDSTDTTYPRQHLQQRTHSEACAVPGSEMDRRNDYSDENDPSEKRAPKHASTMPPISPIVEGDAKPPYQHNVQSSRDMSSSDTQYSSSREAPTTTVRKRDKLAFWKKNKDGDKEEEKPKSNGKVSKYKDKKFTLWGQLRVTIFGSWINILLICVPIGIALHFAKVDGRAIFVVNFLAIMPLAGQLSYATEEIALRTGETLGGLLNASFGNAVELIVSIIALFNHQTIIVKTSLIGSMLSNLLLVLGMCFFFGGIGRLEQHFNVTVAQTASSLLALAVGSLIIPTVFLSWSDAADTLPAQLEGQRINQLSRATAVVLLFVYGCYLFFQLFSHKEMYNEPSQKSPKKNKKKEEGDANKGIAVMGAQSAAVVGGQVNKESHMEEEEEEEEEPHLSVLGAIAALCIATAFTGWCAEYMVEGISSVTKGGTVSPEFIGLILIPIVGNAAEHATAVTVAIKDKMDLAIGVAVGSSMQIALLILPFVVVVAWIAGVEDMNLDFDGFQLALLFVAVLLVNYLIGDGKSHWLEGILLMSTYIIIAVAAWFYPADESVIG